jgi:hypothetical protein
MSYNNYTIIYVELDPRCLKYNTITIPKLFEEIISLFNQVFGRDFDLLNKSLPNTAASEGK